MNGPPQPTHQDGIRVEGENYLAKKNESLQKTILELQTKLSNQVLEIKPEFKRRDLKIFSLEQEIQRYQKESQNWLAIFAQQNALMDILEIPPQNRNYLVFSQKIISMMKIVKSVGGANFANKQILEDMNRKLIQANNR